MKFYQRLRTKLIISFSIITLIPTLITGIYSIQVSSDALRKQALTTQTIQSKTLANNITNFLSGVKSDLLFLRQAPLMKEFLTLQSFQKALLANKKLDKEKLEVLGLKNLTKNSIQAIIKYKRQQLEQEFFALSHNRRIYYQIRYINEIGKEIIRIDSNGFRNIIVAQDKLQNKFDRYYFKKTIRLSGKQLFVSNLDLNKEKDKIEKPYKPVIRYAVNIYDDNNNKVGILIFNVDANQFIKPLDGAYLVNSDGFFANHPDRDKIWGGPSDLNTGYQLKNEYSDNIIRNILNKNSSIITSNFTLSHAKVSIPGSTNNWIIIIQRNTNDVLASVINFRITFILIIIASIILALLFALLFSAGITKPIEYLTKTADAISKGELISNHIEIKDKSEIGQLAQSFERMRVSMIKSFERLRRARMK